MTAPHVCVDCLALPEDERPSRARPAPCGAGRSRRCVSHHRAHTNALKLRRSAAGKRRRYGIDEQEQAELIAYQDGKCPICLCSVVPDGKRRPATDHDHACCPTTPTCGECTRGITCNRCNGQLIGGFYDLAALERAVAYLKDPPLPRMRAARIQLETAS